MDEGADFCFLIIKDVSLRNNIFCRMQLSTKEGSDSRQSNIHLLSSAISAHFRNYSSMVDVVRYFLFCAKLVLWLLAAMICRLLGFNYFYLLSGLDNVLIYNIVKVNQ